MVATTSEMVWRWCFLKDLGIITLTLMPMNCDNHATIVIARIFIFHKRTTQIKIDYYFICDNVLIGVISTPHMS